LLFIEENKEGEAENKNNDSQFEQRSRNKTAWPPTMDNLLEYITIYSQMNNLKFASLNKDMI